MNFTQSPSTSPSAFSLGLRAAALTLAALALSPSVRAQEGAAASAPNRSIVGGMVDQAAEAGRSVGSEARKVGTGIAQGAREAASAAASGARQIWTGAKSEAKRVGSAASSAAKDIKSSGTPASQAPAPVETRSTTR
jgi:hypothetical protein